MLLTKHIAEVFYKHTKVAAHVRLDKQQCDPVIKSEHMPDAHRRYLRYNVDEFVAWVNSAGSNIVKTVRFFGGGKEVEQGFKSFSSLMKLEKRYSTKRLDDACEGVLRLTSYPTFAVLACCVNLLPKSSQTTLPSKWKAGTELHVARRITTKEVNAMSNNSIVDQLRKMRLTTMAKEFEGQSTNPATYSQIPFE